MGDSIVVGMSTYGGGTQLLTDDTWIPETVAEVGISARGAIPVVEARAAVPAVVVVGLGTNPSSTLGEFPDEIATIVDDLRARGARHILWIPPCHADPERYAERDAALRAIEDPHVDVLDWPYVIGQHPEWFQGDGLHLTAEGYAALAVFVRDSLRTLPA
jgi:lysophospholipase L1-like esterase